MLSKETNENMLSKESEGNMPLKKTEEKSEESPGGNASEESEKNPNQFEKVSDIPKIESKHVKRQLKDEDMPKYNVRNEEDDDDDEEEEDDDDEENLDDENNFVVRNDEYRDQGQGSEDGEDNDDVRLNTITGSSDNLYSGVGPYNQNLISNINELSKESGKESVGKDGVNGHKEDMTKEKDKDENTSAEEVSGEEDGRSKNKVTEGDGREEEENAKEETKKIVQSYIIGVLRYLQWLGSGQTQ